MIMTRAWSGMNANFTLGFARYSLTEFKRATNFYRIVVRGRGGEKSRAPYTGVTHAWLGQPLKRITPQLASRSDWIVDGTTLSPTQTSLSPTKIALIFGSFFSWNFKMVHWLIKCSGPGY